MKKYILKEHRFLFFIILFGILATISKACASIIQMSMLDTAMERNIKGIIILLGINGLNWFLFDLLEYARVVLQKKCIVHMNHAVRESITNKLKSRSYDEFKDNNTGEYLSWYVNDVMQMQNLGFEVFFKICTEIISLLVGIIILLRFHWLLVIAAFIQAVIIAFVARIVQKSLKNESEKVSKSLEIFSEKTKELIASFWTLKCFGHVSLFEKRINEAGDSLETQRFCYEKQIAGKEIYVDVAQIVGGIIANGTLFILSMMGIIPFSTFFGGCNLLGMVSNATNSLGQLWLTLFSSSAYFEKVEMEPNEEIQKGLEEEFSGLEKCIRMENISFSYGKKVIFDGLSLSFEKNNKYALLGKSGAGKSTILKMLMGFLDKYNGTITYDDKNIKDIRNESLWSHIAYIDQDSFLFNDTILNNITLGMEYDEERVKHVLIASSLINDIEKFENGLYTKVGENGNKISGGQRQRIAIARALFHHRNIIFMDEGTSALDKTNAVDIENSLLKNPEITLILISHNLDNDQRRKFDMVYELQ